MMGNNKCNFIYIVMLLLLGATSMMVGGCQKDYDGQLEIIRNQIKSGEISLDNLNAKLALIEKQIETLQKAVDDVETSEEHKKDIKAILTELEAVKTTLNSEIDRLEQRIKDNDNGLLELKNLIESTEEQFNQELKTISGKIQNINTSLDELDGRIGRMEEQVGALQEKQDAIQDAIVELQRQIEAGGSQVDALNTALKQLQDLYATLSEQISAIKQKLESVKDDVDNNTEKIKELAGLIGSIQTSVSNVIADNKKLNETLTALEDKVNSIDEKYGDLIDKKLEALRSEFQKQLDDLEKKIGQGSSAELQKEIDEIKEAIKGIDSEIANNASRILVLEGYSDDHEKRLKKLEEEVAAYTAKFEAIESRLEAIEANVDKLLARIQSMEIVPKYNGSYVSMESSTEGKYELTVNADIRPLEAAKSLDKSLFSISVKEIGQIETRAASSVSFDVQSVVLNDDNTFTIKATTNDIVDELRYSAIMNFQVALALKGGTGGNDRATSYAGVYYVAPNSQDVGIAYSFYQNSDNMKVSTGTYTIGGVNFDGTPYIKKILKDGQILSELSESIFTNGAYALKPGDNNTRYDVTYNLTAVIDAQGQMSAEYSKYVKVTSSGYIQKGEADYSHLGGYKLIISLQAKKHNIYFGNIAFICVELGNSES